MIFDLVGVKRDLSNITSFEFKLVIELR